MLGHRTAFGATLLLAALLGVAGPARAEAPEVRIGVQYGLIYLPAAVAETEGIFAAEAEKRGLGPAKLSLSRFSGSTAVNEALLSGNIDFGTLGLPGMLIIWDKTRGHDEVHGLAGFGLTAFVLETNRAAVKALADFGEQDRIAVPALNSPQALLLEMGADKILGAGGRDRIAKLLVSLPHPDATTALMAGKSITGYFASPPFYQTLAKDAHIHPVLTSRDILGGTEATGIVLAGGRKFAAANPKTVEALYAAIGGAVAFIRANPKRAAEIYLSVEKSSLPQAEIERLVLDGTTDFRTEPKGVLAYARFMHEIGMIKTMPGSWQDIFFPYIRSSEGS